MATSLFTKATRREQKLKIGLTGPSGGGKSLGALALAHQLAQGKPIAAIDTENGSLSLYGDKYGFDTLEILLPYLTRKYVEAAQAAIEAGYEVLIIDSISHQWDGDGGILQRKEQADQVPNSNHWTNWGPFTKEHNEFRALLLNAPIHIVATMRSKMAYAQSENGNKKKIEKLGLQPIQREGMEYEFTLTFDLQMDHRATASKDRTGLFGDVRTDLLSPKTGKTLIDWLHTAAPALADEAQMQYLGKLLKSSLWTQDERIAYATRGEICTKQGMQALLDEVIAEGKRRKEEQQKEQPEPVAAGAREMGED